MGYTSFQENNLENKLVKIEQELLKLKAIQLYDPQQINYAYQSNILNIPSYRIFPDSQSNDHQGILASLIFTSHFPNIYPRTSFVFSKTNPSGAGVLIDQRFERVSKNQVRIYFQATDTMVPMASAIQFTALVSVFSNVTGVLKLEKTYVLPS